MNKRHQYRLTLWLLAIVLLGVAAGLILYALRYNIDLYYTPSQLAVAEISPDQSIKVGGMVKKGSVQRSDKDLKVTFVLTDFKADAKVRYEGVLPALFREGQGIVVQGKTLKDGVVDATEVLAKHDENYMPPEVKHQEQLQ